MSGKLCTGDANNNAANFRSSRAFCEGLAFRALGTALEQPLNANPHVLGSEAFAAWQAGWAVTNAAAGSTVNKANAPCCSVPQNTIQI